VKDNISYNFSALDRAMDMLYENGLKWVYISLQWLKSTLMCLIDWEMNMLQVVGSHLAPA